MATTVFDLVAKLSLDSSEFDSGMDDAESKSSSFGDKLKSGLGSAAKVGAGAVAALGTAAIAAGTSLVKGTGDVAAYGDNIDKMSQKMGISAQAYQEWDAIMQHSGTSIDALKPSMKTLATQAEKGSDAFQKLGISEKEVASLSQEDLFAKVITGLQGMKEGTERTYITSQLLGRGATELGALLNTSAEETQKMRDRVHELGGVMSDDAVKASAQFQDTLQDMSTGFDSLKRNMLSEFLPAITGVMDGLTNLFTGNYDEGIERISKGIGQVIDKLSEMLPKILEVGKNILLTLGNAIIQNLPVIMPALADLVMGIGQSIIDNLPMLTQAATQIILMLARFIITNLPQLFTAAIQIIVTLVQGITEALPELIPAAVEAILTIVQTLVDNLPMIIDAALQLITALTEGLIDALPILIDRAPEIIIAIVDTLVENFPKIVEAAFDLIVTLATALIDNIPEIISAVGKINEEISTKFKELIDKALSWGADLVGNFVSGLKDKWKSAKSAVSEFAGGIKSFLGFSEPEVGPLSDFHTYAPDMMKLFAQGIDQNLPLVENSLNRMGNMIRGNMQFSTEGVNRGATYNGGITINVYGAEGQNVRELAREIEKIFTLQDNQRRAAYA